MTSLQKTFLAMSIVFLFLGLLGQNLIAYVAGGLLLVAMFIVGKPLKRAPKKDKSSSDANSNKEVGNTLDQRLKSLNSMDTNNQVSNKMSGFENE